MKERVTGKNLIAVLIEGLFLASFLLSSAPRASAYNDQTTHPDLIRETIIFYELSTGKKLTDEQKQWIAQGSIDEDKAPRWINHFYDPAFERGLSTTALGFGYAGYSAKNWAQFSSYQTLNPANLANLWTGNGPVISGSWWGDFSYEAAIKNYSQSKEKEAYVALGDVLHVIADMTVPEHVRNEAHPAGSFYETWTMNNSAGLTQDLGKRLFNQGQKLVIYGGLETYFNELANYTNTHFFSPQTINSELYQKPKIVYEDGTFAYGYDENYQLFDLAAIETYSPITKNYTFNLKNSQISQEYWTRLSRQALVNGAGIINLFVNEAEAAKKVELAKQKVDAGSPNSPQGSFIGFLLGLISFPPGEKSPEPAMTIIAGEPKLTAPKITLPVPKITPPAIQQAPAASPPVLVAPKVTSTPAPSTAPAVTGTATSTENNIGTETPTSTPAQTYSGGSSSNATEQTTAQTFAAGVLVINEIMFDLGGDLGNTDTNREWIEIYNNSSSEINLTDWKFNDGDEATNHGLNVPPKNGGRGSMILPAAGYFILAEHAETFLTVDHIGFTGTVIDTVALNLKDATSTVTTLKIIAPDGTAIDEVTYYNSWGGNGNGKTLERITAGSGSSDVANWGASSATGGTPGAVNNPIAAGEGGPLSDSTEDNLGTGTTGTDVSATTTISQNTTWTLANSPYRLFFDLSNRPTVNSGATLTIEPGVKIIPQSSGATALEIKGTLQAMATSGAPIIFTSIADADGLASTTPQKGDWLNIVFSGSGAVGAAESNLNFVEFRYGGQGNIRPLKEMVKIIGATVNIKNSRFENAQSIALRLIDSNSVVENSVFSDNDCAISIDSLVNGDGTTDGGCYGVHSIFSQAAATTTPQIKNNQFVRNRIIAIEIRNGSTPIIDNNVFTDNGYPARVESSYPVMANSQITNSTTSPDIINGIAISGRTHFSKNFTLKKDLPYILESDGTLAPYIDAGATLTIEPETILKSNNINSILFVNGSLIASTTPASPIVFTSSKDVPQAGDWGNIRFNAGSSGTLTNVGFYYGGCGYIAPLPQATSSLLIDSKTTSTWINQPCIQLSSGYIVPDHGGNFKNAVIHNWTNRNGNNFTIYMKEAGASDFNWQITEAPFLPFQTYDNAEINIPLTSSFAAGKKYMIEITASGASGTACDYGVSGSQLAVAFYESVIFQPYSNPALSIDAAATVVVE